MPICRCQYSEDHTVGFTFLSPMCIEHLPEQASCPLRAPLPPLFPYGEGSSADKRLHSAEATELSLVRSTHSSLLRRIP